MQVGENIASYKQFYAKYTSKPSNV